MFSDHNIIHLLTILEAIEKCFIYTEPFNDYFEFTWQNNQLNFNASVTLLIAIGEETKNIDEGLKAKYPKINWIAIAAMRNRMAHNYRGIDPEMTFDIIKDHLPDLKETVIEMFKYIQFENEMILQALQTEHYSHISYLKVYLDLK